MAGIEEKESKVSLTNWTRLNNAPLLLPQTAAVQWNEYIFLLAKDGTALLYHTKYGMWSMLPKCPYELDTLSVVNYNEEVLVATKNRPTCIAVFSIPSSQWIGHSKFAYSDGYINHLLVRDGKLYADTSIYERYTLFHDPKWLRDTLLAWTDNGWTEVPLTKSKPTMLLGTSTHLLIVVYSRQMYIKENNLKIYLISPMPNAEDSTEKEIVCPPSSGYTLHVINDTLFSFGGRDQDNQPLSDVLRYNMANDKWENAGYMRSARYNTTVVTVQQAGNQELLVIGGSFGSSAHKMVQKVFAAQGISVAQKTKDPWENATCILEKCTIEN